VSISFNLQQKLDDRKTWCFDSDLLGTLLKPANPAVDVEAANIIRKCISYYGQSMIDLDKRDANTQATALIFASYFNYKETVNELIKNDADLNMQDKAGKSALMYAVAVSNADIANILIDAFADVTLKDNYKSDALIWSSRN
jgi:ankyrin repeat protein